MVSDKELADAFFDEWRSLEELRTSVLAEILDACRIMHNLQKKLSEGMVQILIENPHVEYNVSKDLAEGTASLLKAMRGLERKAPIEHIMSNGEEEWDSQNGTV